VDVDAVAHIMNPDSEEVTTLIQNNPQSTHFLLSPPSTVIFVAKVSITDLNAMFRVAQP
jgi:hypothetical protein